MREDGEAALAHASRGRPSPRRLPARMRDRILHLARTRYVGFNDHHLCEKLGEIEGISLGRETLRRLLRQNGLGSPKKRRAPAHRQRRLCRAREGEMLLLDGSLHRWLEERGPQLTLLGFLDDATRKVPVAEFFPTEDAHGYFQLLRRLLRRYGVPLSFYGDKHGVFVRNDDHWTVEEQLAGKRQPTQFGRALAQLGVTYIPANSPQAKGRIERLCGALFKIALPVNSASWAPPTWPPPTRSCVASCPTTIAASAMLLEKRKRLGVRPLKISAASAALSTSASSAMTTSCNGTAAVSKSRPNQNASASPVPRFSSANHFEVASRSTTETASFIMRTNNEVTLSSGR